MGYKARLLSDGTISCNQLITGHPCRINPYPIEFGAIITAPTVGQHPTLLKPAHQLFRYVMLANPRT